MNETIFLDTVGLLALWDRADQWHAAAEQSFAELLRFRVRFMTMSFVLLECGNAVARRPFRSEVVLLRERLDRRGDLIEPTISDCEQAWAAFARGDAAQAGIVDQVSFAVMKRLGLTRAFTNDGHFRAAGFETLF